MRLHRAASAVALTASLALAGCGSSAPTILDTEKVERAIEQSSIEQRDIRPRVSCPSGVRQEAGLTFSCTATARGTQAEFVVTQTDGSGQVSFEGR